jgi:hypothetical protein
MSKMKQELSKALLSQFDELRAIIETSRNQTCRFVNEQLLNSYWAVGGYISQKLKTAEWGNKVVDGFSEYFQTQCPDIRGYGRSSLYNMVKFYETYSAAEFTDFLSSVPQIEQFVQNHFGQIDYIQQNADYQPDIIVQKRFGQLQPTAVPPILYLVNWSSHLSLLSYCRTPQERAFYMLYAHKENLNYEQLKRQIQTGAMTALLSDRSFLSKGFHSEYPQKINQEFTAADMGQLELYLEALDRNVRRSNENPSIGIILCPKSDRIMIEYAMNRTMSPAMVTEYESKLIPLKQLQTSLDSFGNFLESGLNQQIINRL